MEKILVTIPNYNHSKYLEQSILSIQNQSHDNLDICICDDGSDDQENVDEIVNNIIKSDDRVRYIKWPKNVGKWHALNNAIKTTKAKICTSHDADDISLPSRIKRQYRTLQQTNSIHNLCGFKHCWNEKEVNQYLNEEHELANTLQVIHPKQVHQAVMFGRQTPGINHYFTGDFETAGVSAMFIKEIFNYGIMFNPPHMGLRTMISEDSDFNFRVTSISQCLHHTIIYLDISQIPIKL